MPKVLCKGCSFPVTPTMAHCPRCGKTLPYLTSRRKRESASGPSFITGKQCPRCGHRTKRWHTPLYLRPLRLVLPHRFTYRHCDSCGWSGGAFHAPSEHGGGQRRRGRPRRQPAPDAQGD